MVDLVDVETEDGLQHTGALAEPAGGGQGRPAVLLMHGSAMNFYHPFLRFFLEGLRRAGYVALAANNRGHDLVSRAVGPKERVTRLESIPDTPEPLYGTAYESFAGIAADWRTWIRFLAERGRRVVLWAHSRGAVKTAYYLAEHGDDDVVAAVLCSPPRFSYRAWVASARGQEFLADLGAAEAAVARGEPEALLHVRIPMDYLATAANYVDQYGPAERYDVFALLPRVRVPVLVLSGTAEVAQRFGFDELPEAMARLALEKADLSHRSVPEGDHLYTGQERVALDHILAWLATEPWVKAR
jgi:pimeloyl-ACP methyl ester carboxylesterase